MVPFLPEAALSIKVPANLQALPLTGERTLPGIADENYWFRRHEAAYRSLAPYVTGAIVLEAGAGEGYGADLLRRSGAHRVVALDYDAGSIRHIAVTYPQVPAVRGDLQRLPLAAGAVEVVAHLQTLEHLHDQPGFLAECARVLRPAGTLLLTTPNRLTFSPGLDRPTNPFHSRELSAAELTELLAPQFTVLRLLGVHHGQRLRRLEREVGSLVEAQLARAPDRWGPSVRAAIHRVRANDFVVSPRGLDGCLDLMVVAVSRS